MAPRGRPRKRTPASESGVSVTDAEECSSSSRPRRSRLPKRYFDDDYSPPPSKKRAMRRTPSEEADEEEEIKLAPPTPAARAQTQTPKVASARSTPRPRGRPKKPPSAAGTSSRRKSKKPEDEVVYMDEDSEDQNESSDEEFEMPDEPEEIEEDELELSDIKIEKVDDEDNYCPWIDQDPESLPKLELPESSQDIPLPNHATFDAIEVYEILRSYHRTLRITPFTFEDFCASLISKNNSCIMAEVHMALLKICLKSDDEEQTHHSVTDTNNSINIMLHHLETLTYAEILRQYIEAFHPDETVKEAINADNYPYVGYEPKLVVLLFMCYRFLYSSEYKKVVNNVGKFQNDDNCRVCGKSSGRIVGCTQCEAAFHVECSRLNPFPEVLVCNICNQNNVRGVANALPLGESVDREPLRSQPIGRDRYGRYYWFVARRLVVQSLDDSEIHYYSTPPQLYQLLQKLDRNYYEKALCETIKQRIDEFLEQMTLTVEMTTERRETSIETMMKKNSLPYDYVEQKTAQIYLNKDNIKRMAAILRDCAEKAAIKQEVKDEDEDDEATRSSGPLEVTNCSENSVLPDTMIGIFDGRLINTFWSGGATQEDLVTYYLEKMDDPIDAGAFWRMGDETNDQTFMRYYNYYSRNEMAESTAVRKKQGDKKKYMSSRFAQLDNFEWVVAKDRQFYGNNVLHNKFVAWTLSKISRKIPADLMHRRWLDVSKAFDSDVSSAEDYHQLATCLLKLDSAARKTIFIPQWWSGLGQTKMERSTVEVREAFAKEQQKIKKMELDSVAKDLDETYTRVNYSKAKWPNTYILRQKGETYRNAGRGTMGGWQWVSNKYEPRTVIPERPNLADDKNESVANRKVRKLELLVGKISKKRSEQAAKANAKAQTPNFQLVNKCYSSSCRAQENPSRQNSNCYSTSCRDGYLALAKQRYDEEQTAKAGVLGEDKPWPIPAIHSFATNHGKSLFVLPKKILRQMILTAGCQPVYMPGFSPGAKSNLLIWPYPAPRPTVDLCWRWQTLNARSLHAVALQLKVLWSCIKWNEFDPDDTHPDRRVVIDTPTHDERRRIINHKEMPPYGQYERYELEIEIIPLYEEHEDEDESWTSRRDRGSDINQRTSTRKKRPTRGYDNRQATAIRKEWVDGVTLKVYEIKDYWKMVRAEAEKLQRRKIELMKKQAKEVERQKILAQAAKQKLLSPPTAQRVPDRISVPYMGSSVRQQANGNGRYLEKYNTSQIPPRSTPLAGPSGTPSPALHQHQQHTPQPVIRHVQPSPANLIRKVPQSSTPSYTQYPQQPSTSRAAAGADGTYRAVMMTNGNQGHTPNMRYTTNGYQWHEGAMRGGGRPIPAAQGLPRQRPQQAQSVVLRPFGEPQNEMRRAMQVAEEAVTANAVSDGDDQPPQIPRYERTVPEQMQQRSTQPMRQVYNMPGSGQQMMRTIPAPTSGPKGNFIFLKTTEGPQKMVVRSSGPGQSVASSSAPNMVDQQMYRTNQDYPPGTVLSSSGNRLVAVRAAPQQQQQQQFRQMYTAGNGPRYVRIQNSTGPSRSDQVVRRVIPTASQQRPMFQEYVDDHGTQQQQMRYVLQSNPMPPKISRVSVPRGGMTMQMVQQQQHPDHRRLMAGRQKQKVTTYRDFMESRGYLSNTKIQMPNKPTLLPFEFNEEEEREINEAIAREEEWMRLEEENKLNAFDAAGNPIRSMNGEALRAPPYVSNLLPSANDSPDDKIVKQVLDIMLSQVCRWDRQYGWAKLHMKRARQKNDTEKIHLRKFRMNQREMLIADHMERLKKEINKRRSKMENEAEQQCGLLTPWRKARTRPHRNPKPKPEIKKEVINPADITLGGDTYDYIKEETPDEPMKETKPIITESIASGVARRRRTSANLSKSEDDADSQALSMPTTRGTKERRTSEPIRGAFYGFGSGIDIDVAVAHCICQQMFDALKFYVQCDMCARWYHGDCVDINEKKAQLMENYTCDQCIEEQERVKEEPALYCLCKKPYDDTKFYVGCDSCQGWFHPECVGTTRELAEAMAEYNCPECRREDDYDSEASDGSVNSRASSCVELNRADYVHVIEMLEMLLEHRMSTPFRNPVDLKVFPDYLQTIKKPMDLSTIAQKVDRVEYSYLREFVNDVHLMFENAKSYNPRDNAVFKCAEIMQEVFEKKLIDVKQTIRARHEQIVVDQQGGPSSSMSSARKRVQSESQRTVDSLDIDSDQLLPLDQHLLSYFNF